MILYITFLVLCLAIGFLLFKAIPRIPHTSVCISDIKLSVIIPVRNEQETLPLLLDDLSKQTCSCYEIICVDDSSDDNTLAIIKAADVEYIEVTQKPSGWMGKTWACHLGGQKATGDLFLFIDSDVRIGPKTLNNLVNAYKKNKHVISVQPFHIIKQKFENFAFFFNVIGVAANGVGFPYFSKKAGLFGPVILMHSDHFKTINGYEHVKNSIIEDVEMATVLENHSIKYDVFVGDKDLSFRMYATFSDLFFGYSKNFASGAGKTPMVLLILNFLWIQALTALPLLVMITAAQGKYTILASIACIYVLTVLQLQYIGKKIGKFSGFYIMAYPILLLVFHAVFVYSAYLKTFKKNVRWKGRDISLKR